MLLNILILTFMKFCSVLIFPLLNYLGFEFYKIIKFILAQRKWKIYNIDFIIESLILHTYPHSMAIMIVNILE